MTEELQIHRPEWAKVKEYIKQRFGEYPSLTSALFVVGLNEIGLVNKSLTKEEKQDVIHVAVCALLAREGYYEQVGKDSDGWPHYKAKESVKEIDIKNQENLLKHYIIEYFTDLKLI